MNHLVKCEVAGEAMVFENEDWSENYELEYVIDLVGKKVTSDQIPLAKNI